MGRGLATEEIRSFLIRLGQQYPKPTNLYLLGGSALCYLGSPRRTIDIDIAVDISSKKLIDKISAVADELHVEVEIIPIDEFIPMPSNSTARHQVLEKFGDIDVYIFDPYSIALSKLARGFDTDIQDILFLLGQGLIEFDILVKFVEEAKPAAWDYDIDPDDLTTHLEVVRKLSS